MDWTRILAYITGSVDQELLLSNEYLAAENRILRAQLNGCLRLSDAERATLGEIGFRLGRKALSEVTTVAQPDTILAWHRRLIARKFEGSRARRVRGERGSTEKSKEIISSDDRRPPSFHRVKTRETCRAAAMFHRQ